MLEWSSALPGLDLHEGRAGADGQRLLRLREIRGWSLTQVGIFPGHEDSVTAIIRAQTGCDPPTDNLSVQGAARVYKIARDQYWVVSGDLSMAARLATAVPGDVGTVTSLTDGRVRLTISGLPARATLEKLLPIDLRPDQFQVGEYRQTSMHHVGIFIERIAADGYELFLLRTFALTLLEVLQDAALEFGYDMGIENA